MINDSSNLSMRKPICVAAFGEWITDKSGNELGDKWSLLPPVIRSSGYEFLPITSHRPGIPVLVFDATKSVIQDLRSQGVPRSDCILIRVEPRSVNPMQYQKWMKDFFFRSFCPTNIQNTLPSDENWQSGYLKSTQQLLDNATSSLGSRRYSYGLINQNKYSCIKGELYDLRRKTVKAFDMKGLPLTVAGKDWQRGVAWVTLRYIHAALIALAAGSWPVVHMQRSLKKLRIVQFLGRVESESDFLSNCEVAIVIENECTYSSEKLLNALIAGCLIVYVGPNLDLSNFPKNQIIQAEPKPEAIVRGAELLLQASVDPRDYYDWIRHGNYLKSVEIESNFKNLLVRLLL